MHLYAYHTQIQYAHMYALDAEPQTLSVTFEEHETEPKNAG